MTGAVFASEGLGGRDEEDRGTGDFVFFDNDGAVMERGADIEDGLKELWGDRRIDVDATLLDDGWDLILIEKVILLHEGDEATTLHHRHIDDGFVDGFVEVIAVENHLRLDFLPLEEVFLEDAVGHVGTDVVGVDDDGSADEQDGARGTDDSEDIEVRKDEGKERRSFKGNKPRDKGRVAAHVFENDEIA